MPARGIWLSAVPRGRVHGLVGVAALALLAGCGDQQAQAEKPLVRVLANIHA